MARALAVAHAILIAAMIAPRAASAQVPAVSAQAPFAAPAHVSMVAPMQVPAASAHVPMVAPAQVPVAASAQVSAAAATQAPVIASTQTPLAAPMQVPAVAPAHSPFPAPMLLPPPGPPLPVPPSALRMSTLPPDPAAKRQDQDLLNGGLALIVVGGISAIVGTALLVRSEGGLSLTREIAGAVAFTATGLSCVAAVPLLVLGSGHAPVAPGSSSDPRETAVQVRIGVGSVKVVF